MQTLLEIDRDPSRPWDEPTLFVVRPRVASLAAWLAFAGWAGSAATLTVVIAIGMGVRTTAGAAAVIASTSAALWAAQFAPTHRRIERRRYPVGALTPRDRTDLRRCVVMVTRLGLLAAAALPGPVAEHLDEVSRTMLRRLAGALAQAPLQPADRSALQQLAETLAELVGHAERLVDDQRRLLDHVVGDPVVDDLVLRTALLAEELTPRSSRRGAVAR